jgi:hypothetical protein
LHDPQSAFHRRFTAPENQKPPRRKRGGQWNARP